MQSGSHPYSGESLIQSNATVEIFTVALVASALRIACFQVLECEFSEFSECSSGNESGTMFSSIESTRYVRDQNILTGCKKRIVPNTATGSRTSQISLSASLLQSFWCQGKSGILSHPSKLPSTSLSYCAYENSRCD